MADAKGKKGKKTRGKAKANNKAKTAKLEVPAPTPQKEEKVAQAQTKPKAGIEQLAELRKDVEQAKKHMNDVGEQTLDLRDKAKEMEQAAKQVFIQAVAPYRAACKEAGVDCEFAGGKAPAKSPRVRFLLVKTDEGIRVMVKGLHETERLITSADLVKSTTKAAKNYCAASLPGTLEEQGYKWAGLAHRLRKLIA